MEIYTWFEGEGVIKMEYDIGRIYTEDISKNLRMRLFMIKGLVVVGMVLRPQCTPSL